MGFSFFKKSSDAPPDVGEEDAYDKTHGYKSESSSEKLPDISLSQKSQSNPNASQISSVELEKINARVDSIVEWIKQFYERFTYLSESIGSVRSMAMANEKEISKIVAETSKAIDMINELEPDKIMVNYQKLNVRITAVSERVESIKQIHENLMNEIKELKRRADAFIGVEGLLKLNEDVKKDLIEIKKISSNVRVNSDKAEQIFMEIRKGFEETQKSIQLVNNLEGNFNSLAKETERLKVQLATCVREKDFVEFKDSINKVRELESKVNSLTALIEKSVMLSKKNEESIADIAVTIGKENIKKVQDYEKQISAILEIMASFASQLKELKRVTKKSGLFDYSKKEKKTKEEKQNFESITDLEKEIQRNEKAIEELKKKLMISEKKLKEKVKESEKKEQKLTVDKQINQPQQQNEGSAKTTESNNPISQ